MTNVASQIQTVQLGHRWFPEFAGGLHRMYYGLVRYLPSFNVGVRGLVTGSSSVAQDSDGVVRAFAAHDAPLPARWLALRRELGSFSRLAPWKGQHVLLEGLPYLPGIHALLVGDAIFGEQAYAKALRQQSKDLGVEGRVHFLGFRQDIPRLMRLSDLVVHTSVAPEPFGRVIVEGMLARSPVVATRAGGAVEIVDDEVSGILVPPGDASALAGAISGLLTDPVRAQALAGAGYEKALEQFSVPAMLEGVAQQLQEVAAWRR